MLWGSGQIPMNSLTFSAHWIGISGKCLLRVWFLHCWHQSILSTSVYLQIEEPISEAPLKVPRSATHLDCSLPNLGCKPSFDRKTEQIHVDSQQQIHHDRWLTKSCLLIPRPLQINPWINSYRIVQHPQLYPEYTGSLYKINDPQWSFKSCSAGPL